MTLTKEDIEIGTFLTNEKLSSMGLKISTIHPIDLKDEIIQALIIKERLEQEYERVKTALAFREPSESATPLILFKIMVERVLGEKK